MMSDILVRQNFMGARPLSRVELVLWVQGVTQPFGSVFVSHLDP